jgi:hypothetical protein
VTARIPLAVWLLFGAVLSAYDTKAEDNNPKSKALSLAQQKGCTSDGTYCVELVPTPEYQRGYPGEASLRLSLKNRAFAYFDTFGYLLDVIFSPNGRYVAVNNRRANSGDYLWVISLKDGNTIKIPDDIEWAQKGKLGEIVGDHSPNEVMPDVNRVCPDCTADSVRHGFLFAQGWNSSDELTVIEELEFPQGWILVKKRCRLVGGRLTLVEHKAEKEHSPSELVRKAWTWSPFHSH